MVYILDWTVRYPSTSTTSLYRNWHFVLQLYHSLFAPNFCLRRYCFFLVATLCLCWALTSLSMCCLCTLTNNMDYNFLLILVVAIPLLWQRYWTPGIAWERSDFLSDVSPFHVTIPVSRSFCLNFSDFLSISQSCYLFHSARPPDRARVRPKRSAGAFLVMYMMLVTNTKGSSASGKTSPG